MTPLDFECLLAGERHRLLFAVAIAAILLPIEDVVDSILRVDLTSFTCQFSAVNRYASRPRLDRFWKVIAPSEGDFTGVFGGILSEFLGNL